MAYHEPLEMLHKLEPVPFTAHFVLTPTCTASTYGAVVRFRQISLVAARSSEGIAAFLVNLRHVIRFPGREELVQNLITGSTGRGSGRLLARLARLRPVFSPTSSCLLLLGGFLLQSVLFLQVLCALNADVDPLQSPGEQAWNVGLHVLFVAR